MQKLIGNYQNTPQDPNEETPFFWYVCGAIVLILIINDISHIMTGEGIFYNFQNILKMRQPNIEHPDITTLTDSELIFEGQYLLSHINEITERIQKRAQLIAKGWTEMIPSIKSDKLADDLKLAIYRQKAIIEEIEYRAEIMR